jgi:hypothetical protein
MSRTEQNFSRIAVAASASSYILPVKHSMQILTNRPLLARGVPGGIACRFFELPGPNQRLYESLPGRRFWSLRARRQSS